MKTEKSKQTKKCGVSTIITAKNVMKQQLQKKFYAFIVTAMMFSVSANAQIIYTDVNPDIVLNLVFSSFHSEYDSLDLNNDGINDFILEASKTGTMCTCTNIHGADNDYATVYSTSLSWIADQAGGYALNSLIDSSLGWTNASHELAHSLHICVACTQGGNDISYLGTSGNWANVYGKYLPLKIQVATDFYYGWIKLGVAIGGGIANSTVSITIMEYAYNSIPNQPILAGQTIATGITENSLASSVNLYPNPATNQLTIENGQLKIESVAIYDLSGRKVYSENHQTQNSNSEIRIDVSKFPAGVYAVQIKTADFIATKKLIIQK